MPQETLEKVHDALGTEPQTPNEIASKSISIVGVYQYQEKY
jgi:hypothetical protein